MTSSNLFGFTSLFSIHTLSWNSYAKDSVSRYSDDVWWLLASSSAFNVGVEHLSDAFAVTYSDNGSNNRTKEEAIVYFWYEYISECSGALCSSFLHNSHFMIYIYIQNASMHAVVLCSM